MTKEEAIQCILSLGGKQYEDINRAYWLHGHCFILVQDSDGKWEFDEKASRERARLRKAGVLKCNEGGYHTRDEFSCSCMTRQEAIAYLDRMEGSDG